MASVGKTGQIRIDSVLGGISPSQYFYGRDQFFGSVGIDPDLPLSDAVGDRRTSGILRPSGYAKFSSSDITGNVNFIGMTPKLTLIYAYQNNGKLTSYSSTFGSETAVGTAGTSSGNGFAYYNNYLYLATNTDISRYGPLDGSPALTDSVWTGATLGSQTALVNTTYPSIRGSGTMPNHVMHVHPANNRLYICDYDSTSSTVENRGKGLIHYIQTKYTSAEGDTNDASLYNALRLPNGFMPTCLESYGTYLVIGAIQTTNSTINQGRAALFFWDTGSESSFFNPVWLPDPLITALKNVNGVLYIFTGGISTGTDVANGYRMSTYYGGYTITQKYYSNEGSSPLQGAVDAVGDRVVWGSFSQLPTTTAASPSYYASVMAYGSKDSNMSMKAHNIINTTAVGTAGDGLVTALKNVQNSSASYPKFAVGWRSSTTQGIDNQSTTYGTSVFRSRVYSVGERFIVKRIRLNLGTAVAANMTITPKIFLDNFSSSSTLTVVNSTNYASSQRVIEFYPNVSGYHNFCLELVWSGTALLPVLLPIYIDFEVIRDL